MTGRSHARFVSRIEFAVSEKNTIRSGRGDNRCSANTLTRGRFRVSARVIVRSI
jgi:hypothetical protein